MNIHENNTDDILVIGSGVIGLFCAYTLQKNGFQVTIFDKYEPGLQCSFGNAGAITPNYALPNAAPGAFKNIPKWLFTKYGPLSIDPLYFPKLLPWLYLFLKQCSKKNTDYNIKSLLNLHFESLSEYEKILNEIDLDLLLKKTSCIHVYKTEKQFNKSYNLWKMLDSNGVNLSILNCKELKSEEPNISDDYKIGVKLSNSGLIKDPYFLCKKLFDSFLKIGGKFYINEVKDIISKSNKKIEIITYNDSFSFNKCVVTAGAWSKHIINSLNIKIPLESERGYHVNTSYKRDGPLNVVMESNYKFMATPLENGTRFAGTAEFSGLTKPPNYNRSSNLKYLSKQMYPNLKFENTNEWMGQRPSFPDSKPIIDQYPHNKNIILSFGHGHRGLVGAPITSKIVLNFIKNNKQNINVEPFSLNRFS